MVALHFVLGGQRCSCIGTGEPACESSAQRSGCSFVNVCYSSSSRMPLKKRVRSQQLSQTISQQSELETHTVPFLRPRPKNLFEFIDDVGLPEPPPRLRRADCAAQGAGTDRCEPVSQVQAACQATREDLGAAGLRRHAKPRATPRQALHHARAVHTRAKSRRDAVPDALFTGRPAGLRHT